MIELLISGASDDNAIVVAKILENSGYKVRIVRKRHEYSNRWDTFIQVYDMNPYIFEDYLHYVYMDANGNVI